MEKSNGDLYKCCTFWKGLFQKIMLLRAISNLAWNQKLSYAWMLFFNGKNWPKSEFKIKSAILKKSLGIQLPNFEIFEKVH